MLQAIDSHGFLDLVSEDIPQPNPGSDQRDTSIWTILSTIDTRHGGWNGNGNGNGRRLNADFLIMQPKKCPGVVQQDEFGEVAALKYTRSANLLVSNKAYYGGGEPGGLQGQLDTCQEPLGRG